MIKCKNSGVSSDDLDNRSGHYRKSAQASRWKDHPCLSAGHGASATDASSCAHAVRISRRERATSVSHLSESGATHKRGDATDSLRQFAHSQGPSSTLPRLRALACSLVRAQCLGFTVVVPSRRCCPQLQDPVSICGLVSTASYR